MFRTVSTVLLLLFLPTYCTYVQDDGKETAQGLAQLYDSTGLDGKELTERYVLMGLLSNAINGGKSPREERTVRDMELVERGDEFVARVLTQSLAASFEYLETRGSVDYESFVIQLTNVTELNLSDYAGKKRCPASTSCLKDGVHVNNGSKGEFSYIVEAHCSPLCLKDW